MDFIAIMSNNYYTFIIINKAIMVTIMIIDPSYYYFNFDCSYY